MSPYLTVEDLAARWRTTPHAVRNMRSKGQLPPATRIGRRLLWDAADIEAYEAGRREDTVTAARTTKSSTSWPARTKDYSRWGRTA